MFSWIRRLFAKLTTSDVADRVANLAVKALPIVRTVAALTPARTDDEIVRLFEAYALPYVEKFLALPQDKRGLALLDAAATLLGRTVGDVPAHILHAAAQAAYVQYKNGQGGQA